MTNKEMLQMRLDGATYQEIADICGITRQAVYAAIKLYVEQITQGKRGYKLCFENIKYQGIYEHFMDNEQETGTSFAIKVFGNGQYSTKMRNFIQGKSDTFFTIPQIKRMCEIVGKPFELVFKERDT